MRVKKVTLITIALALAFPAALVALTAALIISGGADVVPHCDLPNGVISTSLQKNGVPPGLLRALEEHVGEIVPPGAKLDATDVISTGRNRRLIFVWDVGRRWIVATEHGGRGYNDPIFAYDLSQDGRSAILVQDRIAFPQTVCSTAYSLLSFEHQKPIDELAELRTLNVQNASSDAQKNGLRRLQASGCKRFSCTGSWC
jgi:hypothetical protein